VGRGFCEGSEAAGRLLRTLVHQSILRRFEQFDVELKCPPVLFRTARHTFEVFCSALNLVETESGMKEKLSVCTVSQKGVGKDRDYPKVITPYVEAALPLISCRTHDEESSSRR
jgi:hypothetical protein